MADALTMLRDVLVKGSQPLIEGDEFVFGRTRFPKTAPTAFRASTGNQPYTLNAVYLCHANRDLTRGAYILACTRANTPTVAFNDKKELLAFLDGEITQSASIVYDVLPPSGGGAGGDVGVMPMDISSSFENTQTSMMAGQQNMDIGGVSSTQMPLDAFGASLDYLDSALSGFGGTDSSHDIQSRYKIDLQELELTEEQKKEKDAFGLKIDANRVKPDMTETEDSFIEAIKLKRKNLEQEKSGFVLADETITKKIQEREKSSNDRVSILQSQSVFSNILNSYKKFKAEEEEKKRKPQKANGHPSNSSSSSSTSSSSNSTNISQLKNRTPIIIVPSSLTSPLTIYNALEFLESSKFVSTLEKKQELTQQHLPKPSLVTFDRMTTNHKISYEIIDNIRLLKPDDWMRVAAVFVQGEAWQFKDWKWSTPVDLLAHVKGYYIKFDDTTLPEVVKSWDVRILNLSKTKRHLDQTATVEFWNSFDEYILSKKSYLNH
ncbi:hypothetical protein CYY_003848 [Polysphondylium violaceum]|uniref:RNA polymerase II complex component n=1 Tax=Polysphondylium violaceum TaxID=133409 RepID=A0A8J4PW71_9MYCE|nr:hypothetical protein CYY_003848 [Polysphondylium violaceum]